MTRVVRISIHANISKSGPVLVIEMRLALVVCICAHAMVMATAVLSMAPGRVLVLSIRGGKTQSKSKGSRSSSKGSRSKIRGKYSRLTVPTPKIKKRGWLARLVDTLSDMLSSVASGSGSASAKSKVNRYKSKRTRPSAREMSQNHLEKSFKEGDANVRIQKELRAFVSNPPDGCKLAVGANLRVWVITITGAEGTVYAGERYKLKFVFPKEYPARPPGVYFLKPTPKHMHVYSNGDICLNLLGRDWRPTMTAQTLAVSIFSMLSNAKEKKIPVDNAMHADNAPGQPQDNWMYHDDTC
jgi:ubiquitin-conjugating enzyme E2 W